MSRSDKWMLHILGLFGFITTIIVLYMLHSLSKKGHDMSCGGYSNGINIPPEGALHTVGAHAYSITIGIDVG